MKRCLKVMLGMAAGFFLIISVVSTASAIEIGARGYYWFPAFNADMKVGGLGISGTEMNLKDDLGVGNKYYPSVEIFAGIGKHHLSLMYTPVDYSGTSNLTKAVQFRGKNYPAGTNVQGSLKFDMVDLEYQYDFLNMKNILAGFSLGAIGKIKYMGGDARINAPALGSGFDQKERFRFPIPMIGLGANVGILANILEARAKITGIAFSSNLLYEAMADISWTPFPFIDIHGGYKIIKLKVDMDNTYFDAGFAGPFVALTVSF